MAAVTHRSALALVTVAALFLTACSATPGTRRTSAPPKGTPGFVVVAPDRGFLGNEEVRDAYVAATAGVNAELVFATDERTSASLDQALRSLRQRGAREAVVLPLFVSQAHPRWQRTVAALKASATLPVRHSRPLGESYLAVEMLSDRFRSIATPAGARVIVVGYGATAAAQAAMQADFERLAGSAGTGFGFESVRTLVWPEMMNTHDEKAAQQATAQLASLAQGAKRVIVVPFQLGMKLDSMMASLADLKSALPRSAELLEGDVLPDPLVATWMRREVNRHSELRDEDVGVVFLAHGADHHWNQGMQDAVEPLFDRYKIEFAFSMADAPVVERAIRRLEERGARAIVVVRVFGLAESFEGSVRHMLGLDIESPAAPAHATHGHAHHGHGHGHGHGAGPAAPPARIRTAAVASTVGGLEAHPLFADALLSRAKALSRDPARETVVLVAHGAGSDAQNERWVRNLQTIATRMRANGGGTFRNIHVGTWREDWPDKRESWVKDIRRMVQEATADGGRAIVVPARTTATGPERKYLEGLNYELAEGFAPHPLFVRWVEEQIQAGKRSLVAASASGDAVGHQ